LTVVEQRLQALNITSRLGRLQDVIYAQAGRPDVWHDITQGSNGTLPNGNQSNAVAGWDTATGWGVPDYEGLFNSLLEVTTSTPIPPTAISTMLGTPMFGGLSEVLTSDNIYYQIGSVGIPQFGQAAAVGVQFFVPTDSAVMTINFQSNAGIVGGTNMVWLYNWGTGNYDLIGAKPMDAAGSNDKFINVPRSKVALYVSGSGEVDMILRGHLPIRPFNNAVPSPFTYKLDFVQLLVR
jgi:hypothetical protein